jgi:transposase
VSGLEELSREELIALAQRLLDANAALVQRVRQLEERVEQLERHVSHHSQNSSIPASSGDVPGRTSRHGNG